MDQDLAVALGVLLLVVGTWGYALTGLHRFVLPALRTGILQARGRSYRRVEQPFQFWLGVTVWIAVAILLAYPAIRAGLQFWRRFIA